MENYKGYPTEICETFLNFNDWINFLELNNYIKEDSYRKTIIDKILSEGILDPLTEEIISPKEILIKGENYRESIYAKGLISRTRAVLLVFKECLRTNQKRHNQLKIYSPEAITPFALYMRGKFPKFIGSEYGQDPKELFPIPNEDICNLSFPENSFDFVIVNDVFEHVPHLEKAISEIYRVLQPEGYLISTFPFAYMKYESIVKAKLLADGSIEFLSSPEYHGNPVNPEQGSLVYQIPGWEILNMTKLAGFRESYMRFIISAKYGILSPHISGIWCLVARK